MVTDQWEIRLVRQSDNHLLARALKDHAGDGRRRQ